MNATKEKQIRYKWNAMLAGDRVILSDYDMDLIQLLAEPSANL